MSRKVWNLMYRCGTQVEPTSAAGNPHSKKEALEGLVTITKNGWRCWVEHHATKKELFINPAEVAHRNNLLEKRIIAFADDLKVTSR